MGAVVQMNRRTFLTALTGCAVAKPVMFNPMMASNWIIATEGISVYFLSRDHGLLEVSDGVSLKMDRFEEPEFERILESHAQAIVERKVFPYE